MSYSYEELIEHAILQPNKRVNVFMTQFRNSGRSVSIITGYGLDDRGSIPEAISSGVKLVEARSWSFISI
jgi:hypothetical protein